MLNLGENLITFNQIMTYNHDGENSQKCLATIWRVFLFFRSGQQFKKEHQKNIQPSTEFLSL